MKTVNKSGANLYRTRIKRIEEAAAARKPDRVPIIFEFGTFVARYTGISYQEMLYDYKKCAGAYRKTVMELEPDGFICIPFDSGQAMDAIDTKTVKWPGHGLAADRCYQYVEGEYMLADEYDDFLEDPTGFMIRTYLPRTTGTLGAFKDFPDFMKLMGIARGRTTETFTEKKFAAACQAIYKTSQIACEWNEAWETFVKEIESMGYPAITLAGFGQAPFDFFSDHLRGMKGIMLDMYRQPDKLLAAMEKMLPVILKRIQNLMPTSGNKLVFMGPHRGAQGFMSLAQFEKFYWPGLKASILALVEHGFTPLILWEGDYTSRLKYIAELPVGKIIHRFDRTDVYRARKALGPGHCIAGGIVPSLLGTATPDQVKDECKRLIENVGRDGAYIMSHSTPLDEARIENVRAMIDTTKEYGVYK
jgi:hypothetical protein